MDYVNPHIGGIGHLLTATSPTVQLPHGMMAIAPITTPGINDRYLADKIYGFPAGGVTLIPTTGPAESDPARYASLYDHDLETATPYYYATLLEDHDVEVELTVSERAAYYQIAFPDGVPAHVLFSVPGTGEISLQSPTSLAGHSGAEVGRRYFYVVLSKGGTSSRTLHGVRTPGSPRQRDGGIGTGVVIDFDIAEGEKIGVRVGTSYISIDQARRNAEREISDWDFEKAKTRARNVWNEAMSRITVKGGTDEQRTIFYTALYRTMLRMSDITEDGRYYSGYDGKVHSTNGRRFYVGDNLWDTYRSVHPLQLLLNQREQVDMVRSYVLAYEQSGWLPSAISVNGRQRAMIGHHAAAFITDMYMKGYRDFDVEQAYAGMKKNAMESVMLRGVSGPATRLERVYMEKGFYPALRKGEEETVKEVHPFERRQAVSLTLEHCYDDWAVAQLAKALNKPDDYAYFMKRARNYENVFAKRVGFMAPKTEDGNWKYGEKEFNPVWAGGQGGRDYYTEMNAWIYTFHVQHDVAGLINLMGGRNKFAAKLDALFQEQYRGYNGDPARGGAAGTKYFFLSWFPDQTGLIGNYSAGNEPSLHIPYLYNYAGRPWMTQRRVRQIMDIWYDASPLGISGDDDGGGLSSWYALSAMGIYPVCPGRPVYDIGSPIFEETKITLDNGKVFRIIAKNVSRRNKYVQAAELNGAPLTRPWFEHSDMINGGTLVLEMGPHPNRAWGSATDAAPPSMSREEFADSVSPLMP